MKKQKYNVAVIGCGEISGLHIKGVLAKEQCALYAVCDSARDARLQRQKDRYGAQLAVNFIWPIIFFKLKAYTAAVFVIFILLILVIITAARFKALNKTAFWLFVPYIAWLLFATYLNIGVAVLN